MAVIDLRDDPRLEMQMAQNIGRGLGAAFGAYMRGEDEKALVGLLSQGAAEGKTPEQMHDVILASAKARRTPRGQEIAKLHFEQQTGTGRYDPAVLAKQRLDTEAKQGQIDYNKSRTKYWNEGGAKGAGGAGGIDEIKKWQDFRIKEETAKMTYQAVAAQPGNKIKLDTARVAEYDRRISQADQMIAQLSGTPGQSQSPRPPIGGVDSTALGIRPQQPQGSPDYPSVFNQSPQAAPVAGQPPSTAGNMGPPVTEAIRSRPDFENVPYRQPEAVHGLPAETQPTLVQSQPQSQLQFQRSGSFGGGYVPTPQSNKADAAIAKEIAPEMQLAPSTQAQPSSGQYVETAVNPKTGQRMGFNGKEWVLIQ